MRTDIKPNQPYGAERRMIEILTYVDQNKYSVSWAVSDIKSLLPYLQSINLSLDLIQLPSIKYCGIIKRFFIMHNFLKAIKPDCIVYSQFYLRSFNLSELIAGFLVSKGNSYMIVHDEVYPYRKYKSSLHFGIIPGVGLEWRMERIFQKLMVYFSKYTLAVSSRVKEILMIFHKYPENKIKLFYHGKDLKKFMPDLSTRYVMRERFNVPRNDVVIINTSRLVETKCISRLINAFDIAFQKNINIRLFILGTGHLMEELRKLAMSKISSERINFIGYQEDIPSFLKMSDIFVLPSDIEGFGNVLIEAMATGLISISTNVSGPDEIIEDGLNGFLVEKSERGILDGLLKALSLTSEARKQMSNNARLHIQRRFDIQARVVEALSILQLTPNFYS